MNPCNLRSLQNDDNLSERGSVQQIQEGLSVVESLDDVLFDPAAEKRQFSTLANANRRNALDLATGDPLGHRVVEGLGVLARDDEALELDLLANDLEGVAKRAAKVIRQSLESESESEREGTH